MSKEYRFLVRIQGSRKDALRLQQVAADAIESEISEKTTPNLVMVDIKKLVFWPLGSI